MNLFVSWANFKDSSCTKWKTMYKPSWTCKSPTTILTVSQVTTNLLKQTWARDMYVVQQKQANATNNLPRVRGDVVILWNNWVLSVCFPFAMHFKLHLNRMYTMSDHKTLRKKITFSSWGIQSVRCNGQLNKFDMLFSYFLLLRRKISFVMATLITAMEISYWYRGVSCGNTSFDCMQKRN